MKPALLIPNNQKGLVLITGLVFLLVISMAAFSTLTNLAIFSQNHANEIAMQKSNYAFDQMVMAYQQQLSQKNYTLKQFSEFSRNETLFINSGATQPEAIHNIFSNQANYIHKGNFKYCLEYIGSLQKTKEPAQSVSSWVVRLIVINHEREDFALINWFEVVPEQATSSYQVISLARREYYADEL